ncbi:MAG: xylulokinase [Anaerolineae bacterium]|nr:xylulokinase [Anaerolineae bacterium]MDQ7036078.1 xylulokinase [Anaerolineae bacterium]
MAYLLGIDIGTSTTKAVVFDSDSAKTVAVSSGHEYPIHKRQANYAEQNPDDWWQATIAAVRDVMQQLGTVELAGIGFSGQMHGTVLLNADKQVIHPAIIWADQRSSIEVAALLEPFADGEFANITGTNPAVGFMGATLLWLKTHHPTLLNDTKYAILPKDYVRLQMTGQIHSEPSDAASSALFDIRTSQWSRHIIEKVGLPYDIFPPLLSSADVVGELTSEAAQQFGLKAGIPVVAGCADQPAQALGNGLIATGQASVTIGSGGQVFVPLSKVTQTDSRLHIFNHAVPNHWYILGAVLSAGLSLRWLRDVTGLQDNTDAYAILSREAAEVDAGADGLLFLPYLAGERTPHMNPHAKGVFFGLSYHHERGHLARAVMEGVAFALRQTLQISLELGGQVDRVIASGGGLESAVWRQIVADVFGLPLHQSILTEQAGIGAALLAGVGTGIYANFEAACRPLMTYGRVSQPNTGHQALYQTRYEQFLRLYPLLQSEMEYYEKR